MPKFGRRSRERLKGVDARLVNVLNEVVKNFDITVIEQGKSKTKFGKHVLGKAVDISPYPIDWDARDDFHYLGGFVLGIASKLGVDVRWGGDWNASSMYRGKRTTKDNNFDDLVHFELKE